MAYGEYEPILDNEGNAIILGKGSFGKVYLVRKAKLGRRYALKLLGHEHLDRKSSAHGRFLREVTTFADLRHTHIVNIADYGECEEGTYYVMDYCEGGSLETLVRNLRPFSVPLTLRLLDKAAAALEYAHSKGLIHRDIKPENLMLLAPADRDDDLPDLVRLIDFGLAKDLSAETTEASVNLTMESQVLGTPLYMSPEQLAGSTVDHRADIFSLGITAWYLLAGPGAFAHLQNGTMIRQDRFSAIPYSSKLPDHLTGQARAVVARMIEKEEGRRYQDYRSLRAALRAALDEEEQSLRQSALAAAAAGRGTAMSGAGAATGTAVAVAESGSLFRYSELAALGRDPATGGTLWSARCGGHHFQVVSAPTSMAPALSQLLGRLDVPERPASVVPYFRPGFAPQHPDFPGCCICTTRAPGGVDLLSILRNRRRTTLEEAKGLLQQIAEAMDFARPREIALLFSAGEIRVSGVPADPDTSSFSNASLQLYPTLLATSGNAVEKEADATLGATLVTGGGGLTGAGIPTQRDFAALIYRVLAGREIDPGAFHSARNYKGIGSLQARTDAVIRDLIAGIYPTQSCRALLLTLCSSESIRLPDPPTSVPAMPPPLPPSSGAPGVEMTTTNPPAVPGGNMGFPDRSTGGPAVGQTAALAGRGTVITGSMVATHGGGTGIFDDLLTEPPLWRNLPNAARRQLVSCLRDTWDLRSDIDKDHAQATCYSTQSQTHLQQHRLALKEAEEAARDIESCRRTLQDCYSQATRAIHQIRDSTDPAAAEIRKKDVYGLLEIAEQARKDADLHYELLAQLGPRREALLHEAEELEDQARALHVLAAEPLPEVPVIFQDATTRAQCREVEEEMAAVRALALEAMPVSRAAAADSLYGIGDILTEARERLAGAGARWERIRSSVAHLSEKLRQLGRSWETFDQDRADRVTQIRGLQNAVKFSADSAARFERDVAAVVSRLGAQMPSVGGLPEVAEVSRCAAEAAGAVRILEDLLNRTARVTDPAQLDSLLEEARTAKESAAAALSRAGAAQRRFNRGAADPQGPAGLSDGSVSSQTMADSGGSMTLSGTSGAEAPVTGLGVADVRPDSGAERVEILASGGGPDEGKTGVPALSGDAGPDNSAGIPVAGVVVESMPALARPEPAAAPAPAASTTITSAQAGAAAAAATVGVLQVAAPVPISIPLPPQRPPGGSFPSHGGKRGGGRKVVVALLVIAAAGAAGYWKWREEAAALPTAGEATGPDRVPGSNSGAAAVTDPVRVPTPTSTPTSTPIPTSTSSPAGTSNPTPNLAPAPAPAAGVGPGMMARLPVGLIFSTITEKGNSRFHPEGSLTYTLDGRTLGPVPVSSNEKIPLNLDEAQRRGGSSLTVRVTAPGFKEAAAMVLAPGPEDYVRMGPVELEREGGMMAGRLPATLLLSALLPAKVTVSDGRNGVPLTAGEALELGKFKEADPMKPLLLTFSAEGYQPSTLTVTPGEAGTGGEVRLEPVMVPLAWRSEPAGWFGGVRLTRQEAPEDARLAAVTELRESGKPVAAGRYEWRGLWGGAAVRLGSGTLAGAAPELVLKWPWPERLIWNGTVDLNPKDLLGGVTSPLKQAAARWEIKVPAPFLLALQADGGAVLRITNARVMELAATGLMAGSLSGETARDADLLGAAMNDSVVKPLLAEMAAGRSLGSWFGVFWQAQSKSRLSGKEEWRTSAFLEAQAQVAFLTEILTSLDPWPALGNPQSETLRARFFDTLELKAESADEAGLKLVSADKAVELVIAPDGRSAVFKGPGRGEVRLTAR